jgi:hypothetical protein
MGAAIAISGWLLGRRPFGQIRWLPEQARIPTYSLLLLIITLSYLARWILGNASALHAPRTRARRFYLAHVLAAVIAALVVPLAFAYGWYVRPRPYEIIPIWGIGLLLASSAYPRGHELNGFPDPIAGAAESHTS